MKELLLFIQLIVSIVVIVSILFQTPKGAGLGAISGGAHLFHLTKKRDLILNRIAMVGSITFGVLSLILTILEV
ncbi:preprotein translocase subunit SecG [bacterium]|nr:preprotein translocase subunit SecG [bacterium]